MKKAIALTFLLCAILSAQQLITTVEQTTDPTGNCNVQLQQLIINTSNQKMWLCNSSTGAWASTVIVGAGTTGTGAVVLQVAPTIELPVVADTTDPTKTAIFSLSGGTIAIATTLTFAPTAARVVTFPNASFTVSGISVTDCVASASCASPAVKAGGGKIVTGHTAFSASTTLAITGMPAFTASTSFTCTASDPSNAYTVTAANQSTTAVTFTAGTSNSDTWDWACVGF
jgi:D-arabinose 1-dehydrogenase-like Zn-dependent alcohol dehydrogenase